MEGEVYPYFAHFLNPFKIMIKAKNPWSELFGWTSLIYFIVYLIS